MPHAPNTFDIELNLLLEGVFQKYQHDFRHYARSSLRRRIRQAMERFGCPTVSRLQERLLHEPEVFAQMLQYFTVQVSEMFRDPAYFLALRRQVLPLLSTYPSIRIWVAGCSTGEEVYSLAILLHEEGLLERTLIYATDINQASLDKARRGIFPLPAMQRYAQSYEKSGGRRQLEDYYTSAYESALMDRFLSANVTFADHSLATDTVFSETHLVSCRNVLIYFNRKLQDRALKLFHDSLCHRGFLGLGAKESLDFSACGDGFDTMDRRERLYRKR